MNAKTIRLDKETHLIGIEMRTGYKTAAQDIGQFWQTFNENKIKEKVPNKLDTDVLAVYSNYESDYTGEYDFFAGCRVSSLDVIPEGMVSRTIPPASYAVYDVRGRYPDVFMKAWQHIWDAEKSGTISRSYTMDFEVYKDGWRDAENNCRIDIYIATQ